MESVSFKCTIEFALASLYYDNAAWDNTADFQGTARISTDSPRVPRSNNSEVSVEFLLNLSNNNVCRWIWIYFFPIYRRSSRKQNIIIDETDIVVDYRRPKNTYSFIFHSPLSYIVCIRLLLGHCAYVAMTRSPNLFRPPTEVFELQ